MTSTTDLIPTAEASEASLTKTDVLGRMHRSREQRERILAQYERSGLRGPKFAALCGVKYQTFATWLQRRQRARNASPKRQPQRPSARVQWLEASVQPAAPSSATGLVLQLPGGVRAQLSHPQHIALAAALVRALTAALPRLPATISLFVTVGQKITTCENITEIIPHPSHEINCQHIAVLVNRHLPRPVIAG